MTDHLRGLNKFYYHKVQEDKEAFVLFTDNSKAFDSIHHDFIISALKKQGFPHWFTNSVLNLLTNVCVSPSIAPDSKINIERGVKQGCPLSPLLFILCYDVLHFKLTSLKKLRIRAAADDLALEANDIKVIIQAFPILDRYTDASGLGINRDKTVILSTRDHCSPSYSFITNKLIKSTWPLVKTVSSHKYLGLVFGRNIQVDDVFAAPFKKAIERVQQLTPSLRRLDLQRRILVFNVFITPIFSFVQQFFLIGSGMYREYRNLVHKLVAPFGSSSFSFSQLCAPHKLVGFKQPVRDLWVTNMFLILKEIDFRVILSESDLPWNLDGSFRPGYKRKSGNWESPTFQDQSNLTLMEFLGPDFLNWDGSTTLPAIDGKFIKECLVNRLIVSYSESRSKQFTSALGNDHLHHLTLKLERFGSSATSSLTAHFSSLPSSTPAFLVSFFIRLLCNCLNTDGDRRRKFDPDGSTHPLKKGTNPFPCYLCNSGTVLVTGDSVKHLFTHCPVVKRALSLLSLHPLSPPAHPFLLSLPLKTSPLFVLDAPPAKADGPVLPLPFLLCFCWSVFNCRKQIASGRDSVDADSRISSLTLSFKRVWTPQSKKPTRYGNSSSRSSTQKDNATVDSARLVDSLPPHSLVVYSGCASTGGSVGAGAYVVYSHPDTDPLTSHLFHPLGHSSRNLGVLWSIGMTLTFLSENITFSRTTHLCPLYILTDNFWAASVLRNGVSSKSNFNLLVTAVRLLLNNFESVIRPKILWIPGYVPGCVTAGTLAVRGSKINPTVVGPPVGLPDDRGRLNYSILRGEVVLAQ